MNRKPTRQAMKNFCRNAMVLSLSIGYATVLTAAPAPTARSDKTDAPRSVFTLPSNPSEGRDPFFPDSARLSGKATAAKPRVADASALVVNGFSGPLDHRLVIINNNTFGAGDEGDVVTSTGRLHLHCLEVKTNSVVVEVGGQRRELFYKNNL
jgi:hypothetical protein